MEKLLPDLFGELAGPEGIRRLDDVVSEAEEGDFTACLA